MRSSLRTCVKNAYAPDEFLSRCRDEGLNITATDAHIALYKELVRLDKANKNGIWARIIKNNFAPLFVGRVDYVAGNPPWINWESLPAEYRESTLPVWDYYKLRPRKANLARCGEERRTFPCYSFTAESTITLIPAGNSASLLHRQFSRQLALATDFGNFGSVITATSLS